MAKNYLVTGANGAIGRHIAAGLARSSPDAHVCFVCRDEAKGRAALEEVAAATGNAHCALELCDLADGASIAALAQRWGERPLHALVNNAAAPAPTTKTLTAEGIEVQLAVNVLGYARMIAAFGDALVRAAPGSRVVNVASYWAGDLDLDDLQWNRRKYNNDKAYRQTKACDRMLAAHFAQQAPFADHGVAVYSCHPGDVNSQLSNSLGYGGHESGPQGAATPVWLALGGAGVASSGGYFRGQKPQACQFSADARAVAKLWAKVAPFV